MITNYNNFINESLDTIKSFMIEVNDIDELKRIKNLIENIGYIKFTYNSNIDNLDYFPNWLSIDLEEYESNSIYMNYWSNDGDIEIHRDRVKKLVEDDPRYDKHIYTIKEIQIIMNKIRGYFRLVPNYSPRKIIRENHDN